mmetsp:Transcript_160612/g.296041  ORF Transcript_160612/g.296041 Transcript_160612/m.296041 type:complete len:403 (-) Transcript_160612:162-1370(-)
MADFDNEAVVPVPEDIASADPLRHAEIVKMIDGTAFSGKVEAVEEGELSKTRLYRIRYEDNDLEHFTAADVKMYMKKVSKKPASAMPPPDEEAVPAAEEEVEEPVVPKSIPKRPAAAIEEEDPGEIEEEEEEEDEPMPVAKKPAAADEEVEEEEEEDEEPPAVAKKPAAAEEEEEEEEEEPPAVAKKPAAAEEEEEDEEAEDEEEEEEDEISNEEQGVSPGLELDAVARSMKLRVVHLEREAATLNFTVLTRQCHFEAVAIPGGEAGAVAAIRAKCNLNACQGTNGDVETCGEAHVKGLDPAVNYRLAIEIRSLDSSKSVPTFCSAEVMVPQRAWPKRWSPREAQLWCQAIQVPDLAQKVKEYGVDGTTLLSFTEEDLRGVGISVPFVLRRVLSALKGLGGG